MTLTISSRILCRLVKVAARHGVDTGAICTHIGIAPSAIDDVDAAIDVERYFDLWRELAVAVGDPGFALEVAASANETHNLLQSMCMSCSNVGEGMARASRYLRVLTNSVSWPLEQHGDAIVLGIERYTSARPEHRHADEFGLAEVVQLGRLFTGVEWAPRAVRFVHPRPADTRALDAFFRAPIAFEAARTEVHVEPSTLALPLRRADLAARHFFESYADKLLQGDATPPAVVDAVADVLRATLSEGAPSLEQVALRLGCSGRTLRRRLTAAGTTFHDVLGDVRFALAKEHIGAGSISLAETAFVLGFSEPSAFHRAFRRWTGMTPREYAKQHRRTPASR